MTFAWRQTWKLFFLIDLNNLKLAKITNTQQTKILSFWYVIANKWLKTAFGASNTYYIVICFNER